MVRTAGGSPTCRQSPHVGERFRGTRFVAFSTLCVYPFSPAGPGAPEDTQDSISDANPVACERAFLEELSQTTASPGRLARLN
jgi:hypothetical protein